MTKNSNNLAITGRREMGRKLLMSFLGKEGICPESKLSLNSFVRLQEIEGATIRRSLAEILSGPVALPVSKDVNFLKTSSSLSSTK